MDVLSKQQEDKDATLLNLAIDDVSNYKQVTAENKPWTLIYDYCQKNIKSAKAKACLSVMHENGFIVEKSVTLANALREDAAYLGHCMSAFQLFNDEKNDHKRYVWLRIASNEIVDATYKLGKLYLKKYKDGGDSEAMICFIECGNQHAKALRHRGLLLKKIEKYEEAFDLLLKAANLNDWDACSELFVIAAAEFYKPSLVTGSYVFPCLLKAASAGHAPSCAQLGYAYLIGRQIPSFSFGLNYEVAAHWLEKAVSLGYARACFRLGTMYEQGLYYPKSNSKALALFQKALEKNNNDDLATFKLALIYLNGMKDALSDGKEDFIADRQKGLQLLRVAADVHKNEDAMYECGNYYKKEKNTPEALRYWKDASKKGKVDATITLKNYYLKKAVKYTK